MKLLQVTVPNFRNLHNVELTFEPGLQPSVFPIGSENGGGKSTLLQLIFILFNCWKDEYKKRYLENFIHSSYENNNTIAEMTLLYNSKEITYEFIQIDSKTSKEKLEEHVKQKLEEYIQLLFKRQELQIDIKNLEGKKESEPIITGVILHEKYKKINDLSTMIGLKITELSDYEKQINNLETKLKILFSHTIVGRTNEESKIIICQSNFEDYDLAKEALEYASEHIYLATPPTQPYLFFDREFKRKLLTNFGEYQSIIDGFRQVFPTIYSYNQLSLTAILNAFRKARNQDFKKAIDTREYGHSFQDLIEDYNQFLGSDKYIFPDEELTSIIVRRKISDNEFVELEPEDLSHGELKRLGLYSWIKYNNINDSIILIDEIENGLHPDWQYNIVKDLAEWGDNQYLLATHSFYLCKALTPRHIKVIEPKLSNPCPDNADTDKLNADDK